MAGSSYDGDDVVVKGINTTTGDDEKIKSTGGALHTTGDNSINPIPATALEYQDAPLVNGAARSMVVNASGTPQTFKYQPDPGEIWYVERLKMLINDSGANNIDDFGAITGGLTNGVQVLTSIGGTEYEETNLKDNADIVLVFDGIGQPTSSGFLDSADAFYGTLVFGTPIKLVGDDNDFIAFRIRDNLTGLEHFLANARTWRAQ